MALDIVVCDTEKCFSNIMKLETITSFLLYQLRRGGGRIPKPTKYKLFHTTPEKYS